MQGPYHLGRLPDDEQRYLTKVCLCVCVYVCVCVCVCVCVDMSGATSPKVPSFVGYLTILTVTGAIVRGDGLHVDVVVSAY